MEVIQHVNKNVKNIFYSTKTKMFQPKLIINDKSNKVYDPMYANSLREALFTHFEKSYKAPEVPIIIHQEDNNIQKHICRQCKDCFYHLNSLEEHISRGSWILGYWCTYCFQECEHLAGKKLYCSNCIKLQIQKYKALQARGLKKDDDPGIVKIFFNPCQLLQHMQMHNTEEIFSHQLMLLPFPSGIGKEYFPHLKMISEALIDFMFITNIHIVNWLFENKIHKWWRMAKGDNPVANIIKKYPFEVQQIKQLLNCNNKVNQIHKPSYDFGSISIPNKKNDSDSKHLLRINDSVSSIMTFNSLILDTQANLTSNLTFVDCGPCDSSFNTVNYEINNFNDDQTSSNKSTPMKENFKNIHSTVGLSKAKISVRKLAIVSAPSKNVTKLTSNIFVDNNNDNLSHSRTLTICSTKYMDLTSPIKNIPQITNEVAYKKIVFIGEDLSKSLERNLKYLQNKGVQNISLFNADSKDIIETQKVTPTLMIQKLNLLSEKIENSSIECKLNRTKSSNINLWNVNKLKKKMIKKQMNNINNIKHHKKITKNNHKRINSSVNSISHATKMALPNIQIPLLQANLPNHSSTVDSNAVINNGIVNIENLNKVFDILKKTNTNIFEGFLLDSKLMTLSIIKNEKSGKSYLSTTYDKNDTRTIDNLRHRSKMFFHLNKMTKIKILQRISHVKIISRSYSEKTGISSDEIIEAHKKFISILNNIVAHLDSSVHYRGDDYSAPLLSPVIKEKCVICKKIIKSSEYLVGFSNPVADLNYYCLCYDFICFKCNTFQGNNDRFNAHMRYHKAETPYTCPECNKKFPNFQRLNIHTWTKCFHPLIRRFFSCAFCGIDGFSSLESIVNHFVIMHSSKIVACNICYKVFDHKRYCSTHMRKGHAEIQISDDPLQLIICQLDDEVIPIEYYNHHIKNHKCIQENVYYKCVFCKTQEKLFKSKELIKNHVYKYHNSELSTVIDVETLKIILSMNEIKKLLNENFMFIRSTIPNIRDTIVETQIPTSISVSFIDDSKIAISTIAKEDFTKVDDVSNLNKTRHNKINNFILNQNSAEDKLTITGSNISTDSKNFIQNKFEIKNQAQKMEEIYVTDFHENISNIDVFGVNNALDKDETLVMIKDQTSKNHNILDLLLYQEENENIPLITNDSNYSDRVSKKKFNKPKNSNRIDMKIKDRKNKNAQTSNKLFKKIKPLILIDEDQQKTIQQPAQKCTGKAMLIKKITKAFTYLKETDLGNYNKKKNNIFISQLEDDYTTNLINYETKEKQTAEKSIILKQSMKKCTSTKIKGNVKLMTKIKLYDDCSEKEINHFRMNKFSIKLKNDEKCATINKFPKKKIFMNKVLNVLRKNNQEEIFEVLKNTKCIKINETLTRKMSNISIKQSIHTEINKTICEIENYSSNNSKLIESHIFSKDIINDSTMECTNENKNVQMIDKDTLFEKLKEFSCRDIPLKNNKNIESIQNCKFNALDLKIHNKSNKTFENRNCMINNNVEINTYKSQCDVVYVDIHSNNVNLINNHKDIKQTTCDENATSVDTKKYHKTVNYDYLEHFVGKIQDEQKNIRKTSSEFLNDVNLKCKTANKNNFSNINITEIDHNTNKIGDELTVYDLFNNEINFEQVKNDVTNIDKFIELNTTKIEENIRDVLQNEHIENREEIYRSYGDEDLEKQLTEVDCKTNDENMEFISLNEHNDSINKIPKRDIILKKNTCLDKTIAEDEYTLKYKNNMKQTMIRMNILLNEGNDKIYKVIKNSFKMRMLSNENYDTEHNKTKTIYKSINIVKKNQFPREINSLLDYNNSKYLEESVKNFMFDKGQSIKTIITDNINCISINKSHIIEISTLTNNLNSKTKENKDKTTESRTNGFIEIPIARYDYVTNDENKIKPISIIKIKNVKKSSNDEGNNRQDIGQKENGILYNNFDEFQSNVTIDTMDNNTVYSIEKEIFEPVKVSKKQSSIKMYSLLDNKKYSKQLLIKNKLNNRKYVRNQQDIEDFTKFAIEKNSKQFTIIINDRMNSSNNSKMKENQEQKQDKLDAQVNNTPNKYNERDSLKNLGSLENKNNIPLPEMVNTKTKDLSLDTLCLINGNEKTNSYELKNNINNIVNNENQKKLSQVENNVNSMQTNRENISDCTLSDVLEKRDISTTNILQPKKVICDVLNVKETKNKFKIFVKENLSIQIVEIPKTTDYENAIELNIPQIIKDKNVLRFQCEMLQKSELVSSKDLSSYPEENIKDFSCTKINKTLDNSYSTLMTDKKNKLINDLDSDSTSNVSMNEKLSVLDRTANRNNHFEFKKLCLTDDEKITLAKPSDTTNSTNFKTVGATVTNKDIKQLWKRKINKLKNFDLQVVNTSKNRNTTSKKLYRSFHNEKNAKKVKIQLEEIDSSVSKAKILNSQRINTSENDFNSKPKLSKKYFKYNLREKIVEGLEKNLIFSSMDNEIRNIQSVKKNLKRNRSCISQNIINSHDINIKIKDPFPLQLPTLQLIKAPLALSSVYSSSISKKVSIPDTAKKYKIDFCSTMDSASKIYKFKCHLCGDAINTSWTVISNHYNKKHAQNYQLCTVTLKLTRLSNEVIDINQKKISRKRKSSELTTINTKRRKRSPKKIIEKPVKAIERTSGFCVQLESIVDGEGHFKCKKCSERCIDMMKLRQHIADIHRIDKKNLICLECGENFVVSPSLQMHLKAFHEINDPISYMNQYPAYAPEVINFEEVKIMVANQCHVCMAVFKDNSAIDKHLRVHGMAFLNKKITDARNAKITAENRIKKVNLNQDNQMNRNIVALNSDKSNSAISQR